MPKIEVVRDRLYQHLPKPYALHELEQLLVVAKAELDAVDEAEGTLKIELNDTNRPDLWSTAGLARQIRVYETGNLPDYRFPGGTTANAATDAVVVDDSVRTIRPYIVAFRVVGKEIDDATLRDLIQTQEKLCWNYGQKRRSIAMGVYRADLIAFPVQYRAVDPDATTFVPLGMDRPLSLRQIITEHPKGQEFGSIVAGFARFPFLTDSDGAVLSFPPVINSAHIGAVQVGDDDLFVELTGTDLDSLTVAANIVAADLIDAGFTVRPVVSRYSYATAAGTDVVAPRYFQAAVAVELSTIQQMLGSAVSTEQVLAALHKMGVVAHVDTAADASGTDASQTETSRVDSVASARRSVRIVAQPPVYRNDYLHSVDIVEDVMIGTGMANFAAAMPRDFTVGRLTAIELFSRKAKTLLVGLGYQEMIFNYLGSAKDFIQRMSPESAVGDDPTMVRILNPMSENFEFVRNSALPGLLATETASANAPFPHQTFEVGKAAKRTANATTTIQNLAFLISDAGAGFNDINQHLSALLYFLRVEYRLIDSVDVRFIPGRRAEIVSGETVFGVCGEIHPGILAKWGIEMPCAACEIDLDRLLTLLR